MNQAEFSTVLDHAIVSKSFSGVVSISQQNRKLYEKAFGYADSSNQIGNKVNTRFGIASGTKFFTAMAIGKLIEAKKLSFSTRLFDCISHRFPNYSKEITIGQLLNHTSGIPDYYDEEKITDFENFALNVPTYALKTLQDYLPTFPDEPMKFMPGTQFCYCNGGYILLGIVVEEITGISYQDFVTHEILEPIGMDQSGFFWLNKLPKNTAFGYLDDATGQRTNIYNLPIVGGSDGGLFTTVHDLSILWKAFFSNQILSKELVAIYSQPSIKAISEGENIHYGYGLWIRENEDNSREIYILGGDAGVSFKSAINQTHNLQSTIISNTTRGVWEILDEVEATVRSLEAPQM